MSDAPQNPEQPVTSLTAKAGDKVDNYTIMEQVGAGGTAIVFRGHDHVLNRDVAIKQIVVPQGEAGEDTRQRALSEANVHKRVAASDPRLLVQYIDTINDPRGLFLISEYVDGPSLEWMLQQEQRPMDQRQALGIIAATAKALDALHNSGVVHRDLKPSNILMPREGGLKLADFGLAALVAEQQTMDLGSVRYMAPEVLQGQPASPKSDLYSLGIVAYEMLAGRDKFNDAFRTIVRDQRNQAMRWVKWHTNARAKVTPLDQLVDGIPASLSQLIARMMEKDPARRVGNATELMDAIRSHFAQDGQDQPSPHAAMAPPKIEDVSQTAEVPQKSKLPLILALTLSVWLIAIGGFFIWQNQEKKKAKAQEVAQLIGAIEEADRLIRDQDYEKARDAFVQIPTDHAGLIDMTDPRYNEDVVEAGKFKSEALLAAEQGDFIIALSKAKEYRKAMSSWPSQPAEPRVGLSLINAKKLEQEYDTRAAFQEIATTIQVMLDTGKLDDAIEEIRRTRNSIGTNAAADDIDTLDALEATHNTMMGDERVNGILAEARELQNDGELRDAIRLLEREVDNQGDETDSRVTTMIAAINRRVLIEDLTGVIEEAEQGGDRGELLAALKELKKVQDTEALNVRIADLEVAIDVARAEEALGDGLPEDAQQILTDILERDPDNAQVKRMLSSIEDARKMVVAVRQADQLLAEGKYADAIKQYKVALTYGPDANGKINDKIQDATGRIHLANSEKALAAGDVTGAQDELDLAKNAHGGTGPIAALQERIDNLRDYTQLVSEGDTLFAAGSFGKAKVKYLAAKEIFDSDAIYTKVRDCDFGIWIKQCDQAILRREWGPAESALKRAEAIKINDETRSRRTKISTRVP